MDYGPWLILGGIGALVVFAIVAGRVVERRRREALALVASQHGYEFDPDATGALDSDFTSCHLFNQGRSRRASNLIHKGSGTVDLLIFDYRYVTGSGKHRTTHSQTVIAAPLPGANLPQFEVRPEHIFHKLGAALGYQDIDFADSPEFSSRYLVRGPDEQAVRSIFTPAVIHALQNADRICVEGGGDWLVIHRARKRLKPHEFMQFADEAHAIVAAFGKRR